MTDYRNPALAEVMCGLGYVQRFGADIPLIRGSLAKNGNPESEFEVTESYVALTIGGRT